LNPANVSRHFSRRRTHLVAYPLEKGSAFNMVAITRGNDPGQTWAQREQPDRRQDLTRRLCRTGTRTCSQSCARRRK
jgi:salicylate hydroxylase